MRAEYLVTINELGKASVKLIRSDLTFEALGAAKSSKENPIEILAELAKLMKRIVLADFQ